MELEESSSAVMSSEGRWSGGESVKEYVSRICEYAVDGGVHRLPRDADPDGTEEREVGEGGEGVGECGGGRIMSNWCDGSV